MNKKGQTLILFVILLPILLLLLAFVVDTGFVLKEHTKLNSTTKSILKTTYENKNEIDYKEKIKDLFLKNNLPIDNLSVLVEENAVVIENEYEKESIFGKIVGIQSYKIKNKVKGSGTGNGIQIEKE